MLQKKYHFSSTQYWTEANFKLPNNTYGDPKDLRVLHAAKFMLVPNSDLKTDQYNFFNYFNMFKNEIKEYEEQRTGPAGDDLVTNATSIINSIPEWLAPMPT